LKIFSPLSEGAAKLKKSALVVERGRRVGGVCVHTETIPSKTLRETVLNHRRDRLESNLNLKVA
jgi:pyruvate/2-oxoglutarate dehydrogenase complex dihydrolipoamide dehydrogenase (E3) component